MFCVDDGREVLRHCQRWTTVFKPKPRITRNRQWTYVCCYRLVGLKMQLAKCQARNERTVTHQEAKIEKHFWFSFRPAIAHTCCCGLDRPAFHSEKSACRQFKLWTTEVDVANYRIATCDSVWVLSNLRSILQRDREFLLLSRHVALSLQWT